MICFDIVSNKDALNLVECCPTGVESDLIESVNTEKNLLEGVATSNSWLI